MFRSRHRPRMQHRREHRPPSTCPGIRRHPYQGKSEVQVMPARLTLYDHLKHKHCPAACGSNGNIHTHTRVGQVSTRLIASSLLTPRNVPWPLNRSAYGSQHPVQGGPSSCQQRPCRKTSAIRQQQPGSSSNSTAVRSQSTPGVDVLP